MLYEVPRQLRVSRRMWRDRLTSKATRKSSRNILSELTCTSYIRGATTVPLGPVTGPESNDEGGLDEVPLRNPKNSLTAPSTSPVVYKSQPVLQNELKRRWIEPSYQVRARLQERCLRNPFRSFCDLSSLSQKDGENSFSMGDSYIICTLLKKYAVKDFW